MTEPRQIRAMIDGKVEAVLAEVHRKIEAALSAAPGDHV